MAYTHTHIHIYIHDDLHRIGTRVGNDAKGLHKAVSRPTHCSIPTEKEKKPIKPDLRCYEQISRHQYPLLCFFCFERKMNDVIDLLSESQVRRRNLDHLQIFRYCGRLRESRPRLVYIASGWWLQGPFGEVSASYDDALYSFVSSFDRPRKMAKRGWEKDRESGFKRLPLFLSYIESCIIHHTAYCHMRCEISRHQNHCMSPEKQSVSSGRQKCLFLPPPKKNLHHRAKIKDFAGKIEIKGTKNKKGRNWLGRQS